MKPIAVKTLKKYLIWVKYDDGTNGELDLSHLAGKGIFKKWDVGGLFFKVYIDPESGAIAWDSELDICADNLYYKLKNIDPEKEFLEKVT